MRSRATASYLRWVADAEQKMSVFYVHSTVNICILGEAELPLQSYNNHLCFQSIFSRTQCSSLHKTSASTCKRLSGQSSAGGWGDSGHCQDVTVWVETVPVGDWPPTESNLCTCQPDKHRWVELVDSKAPQGIWASLEKACACLQLERTLTTFSYGWALCFPPLRACVWGLCIYLKIFLDCSLSKIVHDWIINYGN